MRQVLRKKGFTLLELMIVVVIIGILATLAFPRFRKATDTARSAEALMNLGTLRGSVYRYYLLSDTFNADINDLDVDDPNNVASRKFDYEIIVPTSGASFTITAEFLSDPTKTITMDQDGGITKVGF